MKFKVVGVRKCEGEFQGRKWSHTKLYVLSEDNNVTGLKAEFLKVPDCVSLPAFSKLPCIAEFGFDRYGNVAHVQLLSE